MTTPEDMAHDHEIEIASLDPALSRAAAITGPARAGGARSLKAPPNRPMADLTADATKTSGMSGS